MMKYSNLIRSSEALNPPNNLHDLIIFHFDPRRKQQQLFIPEAETETELLINLSEFRQHLPQQIHLRFLSKQLHQLRHMLLESAFSHHLLRYQRVGHRAAEMVVAHPFRQPLHVSVDCFHCVVAAGRVQQGHGVAGGRPVVVVVVAVGPRGVVFDVWREGVVLGGDTATASASSSGGLV